uniref:Transmembrane protein n=1 Tax=Macrostomum lignano TaxID=282301 RepID=A0A1I8I7B3_9PLAT
MALKRCHRLCNTFGLAKFVFLACITLIVCGLIVGVILGKLIIYPYANESRFTPARCSHVSETFLGNQHCESRCSKDKSMFPCYAISVNVSGQDKLGLLYEHFITFVDRHEDSRYYQCSTAPCLSQASENAEMARRFIRTIRRNRTFDCFYRPVEAGDAAAKIGQLPVLLHRIYTQK